MIDIIIIMIISIILGLTSILIGIWVIGRCEGKLRITAIILVILATILTIKTAFASIYNLTGSAINLAIISEFSQPKTADIIIYFFITLLIFLTLVIMNKMINQIANQYKKK